MHPVKYINLSSDYAERHRWISNAPPAEDSDLYVIAYLVVAGIVWTIVLLLWWLT